MSPVRPLSRRAFLRGAGAAVALPFLEAMLPGLARAQSGPASPRRLLAWYVPNGIYMDKWTPAATGSDYALTPILTPLANVKDDVLVLTGLANRPGQPDGPGDHAAGTGAFLTCAHVNKTEGADIQAGISMDQVAAQAIGGETLLPSLQLGAQGGGSTGNCDSGYSCAYSRNISWAGPQTPLAKEIDPRAAFERLFGDGAGSGQADRAKETLYRRSVLDVVLEDAQALEAKLGAADRQKLDEYLSGLRELELRIEALESAPACEPDAAPETLGPVTERVRAMSDLVVKAFECDLTRIVTLMRANAGSNVQHAHLGITEGHHQLSHHQMIPSNLQKLERIDTAEIAEFAYLLERLKGVQEPDGTLLDNSLVFFSSEIEDGDYHRHTNLPVLLAGTGGGAITTGRHVRYAQERPIADLFIAMLDSVGAPAETFGDDGTGPLEGL